MEFFWNDAHDPKYFHILDTETREIERIRNPHTIFEKVLYDDEKNDYSTFDVTKFNKKFVKVIVIKIRLILLLSIDLSTIFKIKRYMN